MCLLIIDDFDGRHQYAYVLYWQRNNRRLTMSYSSTNSDKSKLDLSIPDVSLHEFMLKRVENHGSKVALVDNATNSRITFQEIEKKVRLIATSLYRNGLRKGDIVGIALNSLNNCGILTLAVIACGGISLLCNPVQTSEDMQFQYKHTGVKFIICSRKCLSLLLDNAKELTELKQIFTLEQSSGYVSLEDLVNNGCIQDYPLPVSINVSEDPALILYSSGTTGPPKGILLTHKNVVARTILLSHGLKVKENDVFYTATPSYGIIFQFSTMLIGSSFVIDVNFDLLKMFQTIENEKVTALILVPHQMIHMSKSSNLAKFNVSSLQKITCGSAFLAPSIVQEVLKILKNATFFQGYGLSECTPITFTSSVSDPIESVGKIVNTTSGEICSNGETGEIVVKGPQLMKEYLKSPDTTKNTIDEDGWFHTGDIGHVDKHGFYHIDGRIGELINFNGSHIAPSKLEDLLLSHSQIDDAAVIGVPDDKSGEVPKAFVVRNNPNLTTKEVQRFVRGKLNQEMDFKGGVKFIDMIPRSSGGKILRTELKHAEDLNQ